MQNKKFTRFSIFGAGIAAMLAASGCAEADNGNNNNYHQSAPQPAQTVTLSSLENQLARPQAGEEIAIITTNHGIIKLRLFPEYAPLAVENFKGLARQGFYDGLIFHRVMDNFMIQGGCPNRDGTGGESIFGPRFEDEFAPEVRHIRGALAMANSGPNTNGSQFYIVQNNNVDPNVRFEIEEILTLQDELLGQNEYGENIYYRDFFPAYLMNHFLEHGGTPHLDMRHTVFGQVFEGMDIVDIIARVPAGGHGGTTPIDDVVIESIVIVNYGE